jgi:hypothetical protein
MMDLTMRAMRATSSPARSRFCVVREMAIRKRRSRAVGWRRPMVEMISWSICTSIWLMRFLGFQHLLGRLHAQVLQRIQSLVQLGFHQTAHFEHVGGNGVELGVELAGNGVCRS